MQPIVAIVGRPNVGKSRLFNRVIGRRTAIVADVSGVTRDRHYAHANWCGVDFIAVDTGGLDLDPAADLEREVSKQSLKAIEDADVVVCVFDGQNEPTSIDRDVVQKLRTISKPVIFAVNKIDEESHRDLLVPYHELGISSEIVAVSAEHGRGVDDLLDEVIKHFPPVAKEEEKNDSLHITVVGRPNVGKSTLINRLAGEERVVAHEMPGTTRDSIDVEIELGPSRYVFIDTAGIRRHFNVAESLEKFTALKSLKTIDRAQVVIQLIDGKEGLTKQDLNLAGFVAEQCKGQIMLVNKWDLVNSDWEEYEQNLRDQMGELSDVTLLPISAATGFNCIRVFAVIDRLNRALGKKVATSVLNKIMEQILGAHHLPTHRGKQVRIYYATQIGTYPPAFALFTNYPAAVPYTYRRYLKNRLQQALNIPGVPVKIICKKK